MKTNYKNQKIGIKRVPREWISYKYYDPRVILPKLQPLRLRLNMSDTPDKVRNLRTNKLKDVREAWDAAIFCYLISRAIGIDIYFSKEEKSDYDTVFRWDDGQSLCFAPVQMKELVPEYTNPTATLDSIIVSLRKYTNSPDLIIGIKLNRQIQIDLSQINCNELCVGEIWCFGATTPDESRWGLFGNFLAEAKKYDYELPYY